MDFPVTGPLVIFDCDGVLVDSERLSHTVLCEMLHELGVVLGFDDAVQRFIGTSLPVCMERVRELLGCAPPDRFEVEFGIRTRAAFAAGLTAVPGVEDVLSSLTIQYCVASNGDRAKVDFTLGHTGLLPRFAGRIYTADDVQNPKPAPDIFLHAARSMHADPLHTIVVEDTPTGVTAGKAAGMKVIGFAAMTPAARLQAAGADAIANTMAEVRSLLAAT